MMIASAAALARAPVAFAKKIAEAGVMVARGKSLPSSLIKNLSHHQSDQRVSARSIAEGGCAARDNAADDPRPKADDRRPTTDDRVHISSVASCVATNGASLQLGCFRPERTRAHSIKEFASIIVTKITSPAVTAASKRSFATNRALSDATGPLANSRACARKPMRGSGLKIFW